MEVEQEENSRLIQIYRLANEQLETKNALLISRVDGLELQLDKSGKLIS